MSIVSDFFRQVKLNYNKNYKKRNSWMKLSSTFDYLTEDSMDMGTVWTLEQF